MLGTMIILLVIKQDCRLFPPGDFTDNAASPGSIPNV